MKQLQSATLYALFGVLYPPAARIVLHFYPDFIFWPLAPNLHMGLLIVAYLSFAGFFYHMIRRHRFSEYPLIFSAAGLTALCVLLRIAALLGYGFTGASGRLTMEMSQAFFTGIFFSVLYLKQPFRQDVALRGALTGVVCASILAFIIHATALYGNLYDMASIKWLTPDTPYFIPILSISLLYAHFFMMFYRKIPQLYAE